MPTKSALRTPWRAPASVKPRISAAAAAGVKKNPPHSPTLQQLLEENTRRVLEIWHAFF